MTKIAHQNILKIGIGANQWHPSKQWTWEKFCNWSNMSEILIYKRSSHLVSCVKIFIKYSYCSILVCDDNGIFHDNHNPTQFKQNLFPKDTISLRAGTMPFHLCILEKIFVIHWGFNISGMNEWTEWINDKMKTPS